MSVTGPKVAVLMSVFNDQGYLADAVESILGQTYADFEFLIIDDGSAEPVEGLLKSYGDPRIAIHRQQNMGLTRSLNRGLRLCSGRYVARMDADDVSVPTRLEAQVKELDSDPNLDLVGSSFDVVDASGDLLERKQLITDPLYRLWRLQFHNNYGHGTIMMRKERVMDVGMYDETLSYAQDYDLWSRLSRKGNTKILPQVLYRYRMVNSGPQASVRNYDDQLAAAIRISNRNLLSCNPQLTEEECIEVRALYWKFQRPALSRMGIEAIPATFQGFCTRYALEHEERTHLAERLVEDLRAELLASPAIREEDRTPLLELLRARAGSSVDGL